MGIEIPSRGTFMRQRLGSIIAGTILVLVVVGLITSRARAGNGCCAHCGCSKGCQRICRLVCENKKVTTTCWGCQSEDFCIPDRSLPDGQHCELVCDDNDPKAPSTQPKKFIWTEWLPSSAKIHTKKKLMKRTVTKSIPSYKWVTEDLCPQCAANIQAPTTTTSNAVAPASR